MRRRFVSLWLPHGAHDRWRRIGAVLGAGRPVALIERAQGRIHDVNPAARSAGVGPDQALADARAICPKLVTRPLDPAAEAQALRALAERCRRRYTPSVALDGPDGLALDVTGCAHLFRDEAGLLADLEAQLHDAGIEHCVALAWTPAAAWAWARFGAGGVLVPDEAGTALAALPVEALRLDAETSELLHRLGLRRIGALLELPRAPLVRRVGAHVAQRLDQLLGREAEAVPQLALRQRFEAELFWAEPIGTSAAIAAALRRLLLHVGAQLELAGRGVRRLVLDLHRVDGDVVQLEVRAARPTRDVTALARLFAEHLDGLDIGFGLERMVLRVRTSAPLPAQQAALETRAGGSDGDLAALVDRLLNRFGPDAVSGLAPVDTHEPERAVARRAPLARALPSPCAARQPRPVRLLPVPEPIDVLAEAGDAAPARFRWLGRWHGVRHAEGPERIAPDWWHDGSAFDAERDYYRVETESAGRFWLYRAGRYGDAEPPRWFLHGLFA